MQTENLKPAPPRLSSATMTTIREHLKNANGLKGVFNNGKLTVELTPKETYKKPRLKKLKDGSWVTDGSVIPVAILSDTYSPSVEIPLGSGKIARVFLDVEVIDTKAGQEANVAELSSFFEKA